MMLKQSHLPEASDRAASTTYLDIPVTSKSDAISAYPPNTASTEYQCTHGPNIINITSILLIKQEWVTLNRFVTIKNDKLTINAC